MKWPLVPVDGNLPSWPRQIANAINYLLRRADMSDIAQAERVVFATYGDTVSVAARGKDLNKFGDKTAIGTSWTTVAEQQGSEINETFVSTNLIDSIVSSSASDTTQTITIEGHTIDGSGNLTFAAQNASLNGQTEVTLTTPLARCIRAYVAASGTFNSPPAALVGTVSIYDNTDGITAGVPNTDAATKALIAAGATQTNKCALAISATEYWFISYFQASFADTGNPVEFANVEMEIRDVANGGAWRPMGGAFTIWPDQPGFFATIDPLLIVPKNHDWRVRAKTSASTGEIYAQAGGYLASIQAT